MADSSAVDVAIVDALKSDTGAGGLMTLMTDGVYLDIAPPGAVKFLIVSLAAHEDAPMMGAGAEAYEKALYLVKAVDLNTSPSRANQAAARIRERLEAVELSIDGYAHMLTAREERIAYLDIDQVDPAIRWQHRGGRYGVFVSPM